MRLLKLSIQKIPTYKDLASLYVDGMKKEEITRMYKVDAPIMNLKGRKRTTKKKINNFFKIVYESQNIYFKQPRARRDRSMLIVYTSKKTLIPTTSITRVLEELEKKGCNLQEVTKSNELYTNPK